MNFESKSIRNGQTWEREISGRKPKPGSREDALHLQKTPFNIKQEGSKKKGQTYKTEE